MLDTMVQLGNSVCQHAEFVLKEGVALTPIRTINLDEDEDGGKEGARKCLASCKGVEYVRVDGRPGLCLHLGCCCFWTAVEVTVEVVRDKPD